MRGTLAETLIGALVLLVAGGFLYFAYSGSDLGPKDGYHISASFERIDGLTVGSDVRISGIKVGAITSQKLDPDTFGAIVEMSIFRDVQLPEDTFAKISMDGLLGGSYVSLLPGGSLDNLQDGDRLPEPGQGSIDLMGLVSQLITGSTSTDD